MREWKCKPLENGKLDAQFNMALTLSEEEREKTLDLDTGYDKRNKTWEFIVKYSGNLEEVLQEYPISITYLTGGYAIVTLSEDLIPVFANLEQVEYIEKPKRVEAIVNNGRRVSCITPLQGVFPPRSTDTSSLFGKDILIGVIDSGIDYTHPDFRNEDGTTRIVALWDQVLGKIFTREEINQALEQQTREEQLALVPSVDLSGHGTGVAGIACGNGRASNGLYRGVAPLAEMVVVKLGSSVGDSFPMTTRLMEGLDFVIQRALEQKKPISINLSFGNNYGSHNGRSLLEEYINVIASTWKCNICIGTGNEGIAGRHKSGVLIEEQETVIEFIVSEFTPSLNLQLWKNYNDTFTIELISPENELSGTIYPFAGVREYPFREGMVYVYYGEPTPYNGQQEIFFEFIAREEYLSEGVWKLRFVPEKIVAGDYYLWLPSSEVLNPSVRFLAPTVETTLTIPSTAAKAIAVGAYDGNIDLVAPFTGRGYTTDFQIKPDLAAPGVNITTCAPQGGYTSVTGTSFAAPFVTGSCAMLMEWGEGVIIRLSE